MHNMSLFFLKQNLTDHVWDFRNQIKPSASKIIISQDYVLAWKKGLNTYIICIF